MHFNKWKRVVVLVTLFLLIINISPVFSQQGTIFSDDFFMNAYDWTAVSGDWAVMNGEFTETNDPGSQEAWATAGQISWTDYALEVTVRSTDKDGKIFIAGRWVDINNHYALEYSSTEAGVDSAQLVFYKKYNGAKLPLLTLQRSTNPNVPYIGQGQSNPVSFKISFSGGTIRVLKKESSDTDWVNLGTIGDTSLTYGKIALGEFNRVPYFDNIRVWDITPPTMTNPQVSVTGTTASFTLTTNELCSIRVDYGLTTEYGAYKEKTTRATAHRIDIVGLTTDTSYYYKITVTDAAGNATIFGAGDSNKNFRTGIEADSTPPVISEVVYDDVYANKAIIKWKTTSEESNSTVEYGLAPGAYSWSLSYNSFVNDHAVVVTGLKGSTTYYFRVKSRDVSGNTGVSSVYSFKTDKELKPKITGVKAGSSPSVYVSVYWQGLPEVDHYNVYFSTSNDWGSPAAVIAETGKDSYSFTKDSSVVANVNYFIKIEAVDGEDTDATIVRAFPPDSNPHGYYLDNPELCGSCHFTHRASGPALVAAVTADNLCLTCHDGTQSKYDVINGKYKGPTSLEPDEDPTRTTWYPSIAGPYGNILGSTGYAGEDEVSSIHDLNIYNYSAPGGNIGNVEVADANLSCASCHDPHGSENYRILRADMRCSTDATKPQIDMEAYTITDPGSERTIYIKGAVEFCGSCHSDFNQGAGAGSRAANTTQQPGFNLSAASTHMYMHAVNVDATYTTETGVAITPPMDLPYEQGKIICQTCHFTHGTTVGRADGGEHIRRDGVPSTVLKRFEKTEGCESCHNKTDYPE